MNNKILIGLLAAAVVALGIYFYLQTPPPVEEAGMPAQATTTLSTTTSPGPAAPAPHKGATVTEISNKMISIDESTLISKSSHPTLSGSSNLSSVGLIIYDPKGVGIVASWTIPVAGGKWSYVVPRSLPSATYTVELLGTDPSIKKELIIR